MIIEDCMFNMIQMQKRNTPEIEQQQSYIKHKFIKNSFDEY